ncbi:MAG: SigE family RNA polymerase sigma factor [Nocardioides sp.]
MLSVERIRRDVETSSRSMRDSARIDPEFHRLYRDSYPRLVGQIAAMLGTTEDAEEVVQEAFTRAAVRWHRVGRYDIPAAWVRRVAINLAISRGRRSRKLRDAVGHLSLLSENRNVPDPTTDRDTSLSMTQMLQELPAKYRTVIVLHHLIDLEVAEVAAILRISPNTVKTRLVRGRDRLKIIYLRWADEVEGVGP